MKLEEEEEEAVDADADGRIFRDSRWPPHYITPSERAREGGRQQSATAAFIHSCSP